MQVMAAPKSETTTRVNKGLRSGLDIFFLLSFRIDIFLISILVFSPFFMKTEKSATCKKYNSD